MYDTRAEAKDVICTIITAAGGKLHKKVSLFKAFYAAHLFYWLLHLGWRDFRATDDVDLAKEVA